MALNTQVIGGFKTGMDQQTRQGGKEGAQTLWSLKNGFVNARGDVLARPGLTLVADVTNSAGLYGFQGQLHVFYGETDFVDPGNPLVKSHLIRYPLDVLPLALTGAIPALRFGDSGTFHYVESGGVPPYGSLSVSVGALPPWASMDASGLVTYNVNTTGTWSWEISGQDANGAVITLGDSTTVLSEILATWMTGYTGAPQHQVSIAVDNGIIMACGDNGDTAYSKDNGATWTIFANALGGWSPHNSIKFNGDWYIFSNNVTAASAPGDTFVFTAMGNPPSSMKTTATILISAAYPTGALYVGAYGTTNSSLMRMTAPGAPWAVVDTGFAYGDVVAICQAGNIYFVVCDSGKILKSTDLVTFVLAYDTTVGSNYQCAYLQSSAVIVVVSSGGDVYRSSDAGVTWIKYANQGVSFVTATRMEFLGGRTYSVLKSTDGITWTPVYTNNVAGQQTTNFATDGNVAAIGRINGYVDVGTL